MVIITNKDGSSVRTIAEPIYQGSNNVDTLVLLAPFNSALSMTVSFVLANGEITEPRLMTSYDNMPDEYPNFNGWTISLDDYITQYSGDVQFQFKGYDANGSIIATCGGSFPVLQGTPIVLPAEPTQDIYEDILQALTEINGKYDTVSAELLLKQDKTDNGLNTTNKTVVGAINENFNRINTNSAEIADNTNDIAQNRNEIDAIRESMVAGEVYIGTYTTTEQESPDLETLETQLDQFVQTKAGRQPKGGDAVIVVYQIAGGTDRNVKFIYNGTNWSGYEIPPIEEASNGTLGIIEGTVNVGSTNNTLVDISGGRILNILVKDNIGAYRNIREYLNGNNQTLQNIISGNQQVGSALKAVSDSLGNSIVNTYLTKELGASKQYVRDYAMPREFNDVYFIVSSGYQKEVPTTPESGIQFTASSSTIGDVTLFDINFVNTADFELSSKNGYSNNIYVSSDVNTSGQFRLTTQYKKTNGNWEDLNVELSSAINLVAGDIQKLTFGNPFTYLAEKVISLTENDLIRQTLEFVKTDSTSTTLTIYSNEVYPSIFNLTSQSYTVASGTNGKQIFMGADGIIEGQNVVFTVQNPDSYIEFKQNQTKFLITAILPLVGELDDSLTIRIEFGDAVYNVYSFMKGGATPLTIGDLKSVSSYNVETGYSFYPNLIYIETSDIVGFVLDPATITASQLAEIIQDSDAVVVGLDESGTKIQLQLGAEILNKLMKALLIPMDAPATDTYELPAVDDSNSQVMLTIGSGLTVLNGVLMASGGGSGGGTIVTVNGVAQDTFNADTKLDKQTGLTDYDQIYTKKADGTQAMVDFPTVEEIPD